MFTAQGETSLNWQKDFLISLAPPFEYWNVESGNQRSGTPHFRWGNPKIFRVDDWIAFCDAVVCKCECTITIALGLIFIEFKLIEWNFNSIILLQLKAFTWNLKRNTIDSKLVSGMESGAPPIWFRSWHLGHRRQWIWQVTAAGKNNCSPLWFVE